MKKCIKCKKIKEENLFPKGKNSCKECISIYQKEYWSKYKVDNKKELEDYQKKYRIINLEKRRNYQKKYRQINKEEIKDYRRKRYSNDEIYKLKISLRKLINRGVKGNLSIQKKQELEKILGITIIEFKKYLANSFKENMNWKNYGLWEIDHIIPLATATTKEEVMKLCYYKNLQPLWIRENQLKGYKITRGTS